MKTERFLPKIRTNNVQSELYLTDIMGIAHAENKETGVMVGTDPSEVIGVNTIQELKRVEAIMQSEGHCRRRLTAENPEDHHPLCAFSAAC